MSKVYKVQGSAVCEVCGNVGCDCFEVQVGGEKHIFDSFECALDVLTPQCAHCGTPFVGQGVHFGDTLYCSHECANASILQKYELQRFPYEQLIFQDATIG